MLLGGALLVLARDEKKALLFSSASPLQTASSPRCFTASHNSNRAAGASMQGTACLVLMQRKIAKTAKTRQNEGFGIEAGGEVDSSGSPRQQPRGDIQSEYNFNVSCCW